MKIQAQLAEQSCAQYTDSHNQSDIVGDDNPMTGSWHCHISPSTFHILLLHIVQWQNAVLTTNKCSRLWFFDGYCACKQSNSFVHVHSCYGFL